MTAPLTTITRILAAVPPSETALVTSLRNVQDSMRYSAPEMIGVWERKVRTLTTFKEPKEPWQLLVESIVNGEGIEQDATRRIRDASRIPRELLDGKPGTFSLPNEHRAWLAFLDRKAPGFLERHAMALATTDTALKVKLQHEREVLRELFDAEREGAA